MLVQKGGICREVDKSRLKEYKDKGYSVPEDKKKSAKPEDKKE